ncbi:DUF3558 family protein [Rhodococcus sp. P1Y]|uniref:DUF3558 family protein n=1 Tax=Rhodococcus sp. P1Y TaxID=1302308 RepID=UPI0019132976|nr:DUF3558 family protein [Rhodococcus sp. P1Y]
MLLGACGDDVEPKAVAEPTRWDPCSITPEQIAATGLDPNFREVGWGRGIAVEDWARCLFSPRGFDVPYLLSVKSSDVRTIQDARDDPSNLTGRNLAIDELDAFQYTTDVADSIIDCNIAIDLDPGVVVFTVNYMRVDDGVDPCPILVRHTNDLKSALPSATK